MMATRVRVGGEWLERHGVVGDLEDSTIWRRQGFSGDYEASWTWSAPPDFNAPWFHSGRPVEIVEGGVVAWSGFLGDPEQGDVWRCVAYGWGADAANYPAVSKSAASMNSNVDTATGQGMGFSRYANDVNGGSYQLAAVGEPLMLDAALDTVAGALGTVWWVHLGELSLRSEVAGVDWLMAPNGTYLGTVDSELVTHLQVLYATAVDSAGNPTAVATVTASDAAAAEKFRPRYAQVDATALGVLTSAQATTIATDRFAQVGARSGWANGFEMTALNSTSAANGVPNPMGVRAGHRVRIPGVTDMRSGVTYQAAVEVTLGKVRRIHAEQRVACEPLGLVPRDFAGALAAAQSPRSTVETL